MILLYRCIQFNVVYRKKKERKTYVYMHSHMCGSVRKVLFCFLVHGSYRLGTPPEDSAAEVGGMCHRNW